MKAVIIVGLVALTVAVNGRYVFEDLEGMNQGEADTAKRSRKYERSPEAVVAAKVCKPYIKTCIQNANGDKTQARKCFSQFMSHCMQKIKHSLEEMEKCIEAANGVFEQMQECLSEPIAVRR
ncbi:uncharacterized protein LOC110249450 [Exaiptasia diaphana]|uniref:Uncharacterized protein n=1 Tax=Exaiptasia diaphana TaxID=2652724 RepID=A0A913XYA5_EXADI|nr:uncharacterized protein LOC110249450 [Exaiptasia diaphana]KXJ23966.1 hypothetical protein AC249_AIPGENE181 [Exaiptasia diaphana]